MFNTDTINTIRNLESLIYAELSKAEREYNNADFVWSATSETVLNLETEYLDNKEIGTMLDKAYEENDEAAKVAEDKRYTYEKMRDAHIELGKFIRYYMEANELDNIF